jgi:thymidylate synthase (FAD)
MSSKRPVSPGAEEILGLYFPVLDHGFVALVDYMGTDECVERAARVSYGYGTRKASLTRGLLRYLRRHLHTTPSEMLELKFHCCMPMFIARQWIRHRSACLAGDARLFFDLPGGLGRGGRPHYSVPLAEFHRRWHHGAEHPLEKVNMRPRLASMKLRSCDERTGEIGHTRVVDVWESGVKQVFKVTLKNGHCLKMSRDHRCLTQKGWLTLEQASGMQVSATGGVSWRSDAPAFAVNGVLACRDASWLPDRRAEGLDIASIAERASFWSHKLRQPRPPGKRSPRPTKLMRTFSRIQKIELVGEEMTYDIEVEGPHHNFVADGFIVHNSVNEYSGRYSLMPMLFYTPSAEQLQTQSAKNHQGRSGVPVAPESYAEVVARWNEIRRLSRSAYEHMTSQDIARELARIDLPLSTYTQWYWKIDLHNFLHFLKLRVDAHAQWEIQEYGRVMAGMLKRVAPLSYEAWIDYDVCGARLSRMELEALRRLVVAAPEGLSGRAGSVSNAELQQLGLSRREIEELLLKLTSTSQADFELDITRAKSPEWFAEKMREAVPQGEAAPSD